MPTNREDFNDVLDDRSAYGSQVNLLDKLCDRVVNNKKSGVPPTPGNLLFQEA
jgi:hypothetical protein